MRHVIALLPFKEFGETFQSIMQVIQKADMEVTIAGCLKLDDLKDYPFIKEVIYVPNPDSYHAPDSEFLRVLDECYERKPFTAVISFFEEYVELAAKITERFKLNGNSVQTAFLTRNKYAMRTELGKQGLCIPRFEKVSSYDEFNRAVIKIGFPCIVKPLDAMASEGVLKLDECQDLKSLYEVLRADYSKVAKNSKAELLVEQYIEGPEISWEAVVSAGEVYAMGITEKTTEKEPFFNEIMHIHPAELNDELTQKIHVTGRRAVAALNLKAGGVHMEAKIFNGDIYIIEIASRLGGDAIPALMTLSKGYDPYGYVFKSGLNETLVLKQSRNKIAGIRFIQTQSEGVLKEICFDEDRLRTIPGIINKRIFGRVGEWIARPPRGRTNRLAYVTLAGRNYEEVRKNLLQIDECLTFVIE